MSKVLFVGLTIIDIQYFINQMPVANEKLKCQSPTLQCGGPALNAAVAFSFLDGEAWVISAIGENPFSQFVEHDMVSCNIKLIDFIKEKSWPPPLATVFTNLIGERTIVSHRPEDHAFELNLL